MIYYCGTCSTSWWPYQTNDGACPTCGGGTTRRAGEGSSGPIRLSSPPSEDVKKVIEEAQRIAGDAV